MTDDRDDADDCSAQQSAWEATAAAVRREIDRRIPDIGAMQPSEVKALVDAADAALWLATAAATFDKRVALFQQKFSTD